MAGLAVGLGTTNQRDITVIGVREVWGGTQLFGISPPDLRQHVYLTGKTGTGKTTLIKSIALQHIRLGHGVGVIDPHGDMAEELLKQIPRWRTDHVIYFHPSDVKHPIAFNPLSSVSPEDRHLVASGIVESLKAIWADSWGPRMEYLLYNALAALLDCQNVTLLGVNRMLTDKSYRLWVLRQVKDPFIKKFWEEEYESYEPRFMREAIAPIQNKLGQFLLNPVIRNILGQVRNKVNIPFVMDHGKVFIANLSKGQLGAEKANLLGSLLVGQFQWAAMKRAKQPEAERKDFVLVVDEFQNFSTSAFASILAEARKYRLCLVLSHQYIEQLSLPIRQAVFGNVGTLISFRVGSTDAEVLAKEFNDAFPPSSLTSLNRFEAIVKLLVDGTNPEPFLAKTLPPSDISVRSSQRIIARSRQRFSTSRDLVEQRLHRWSSGGDIAVEPKNRDLP